MMRKGLLLATLALAAPAGMAGAAQQQASAAVPHQQRDWTGNIVRTAEGGIRVGNPEAPVALVEYVSLTCGGCAAFAADGMPALMRDHVRPGRVSLELRNFPLNALDLSAAAASRCAAPAQAAALTHHLLINQAMWMDRFDAAPAAQKQALAGQSEPEIVAAIVGMAGIDAIAAPRFVPADRLARCLAGRAPLEELAALRQRGVAEGVTGTPAFLVNGRLAEGVYGWAALQPLLRPPAR